MLTLFAIPKPFRGNIGVIQHNAIQSWKRMCHACEIILFGSDEGTAQIASELGVKHVPDVATNEHGTPLVNDIFEKAQRIASYDVLTYVNADIILMSDFIQAVSDVAHANDKFLMVGRRWDVDIQELWDFDRPEWESGLRNVVLERGELRSQAAIDYFVFSRGLLDAIPPFAIGRTAWDNWLIFRALQHSSLVVDATECVMAVHQNHDYGNYGSAKALWNGGGGRRVRISSLWGKGSATWTTSLTCFAPMVCVPPGRRGSSCGTHGGWPAAIPRFEGRWVLGAASSDSCDGCGRRSGLPKTRGGQVTYDRKHRIGDWPG